jgi:hypothetical protein
MNCWLIAFSNSLVQIIVNRREWSSSNLRNLFLKVPPFASPLALRFSLFLLECCEIEMKFFAVAITGRTTALLFQAPAEL